MDSTEPFANHSLIAPDPAIPSRPVDVLPTREGYDAWSAIYDSEDNPLVCMESPRVADLLGSVAGLSIADIGCGTGRHALRLAREGARVTAVDFSEGMLANLRAKPGAESIRLVVHDIGGRLPLPDASFDRVICCLVLDHISDLAGLFGELRRICKEDGMAVLSCMHPAMMLKGVQARFTDPTTGREVRPASHPNQISDYVMAAVRAGWTLDRLSEHAMDESTAARSPRAAKYLGWPILLMIRLKKSRDR